MLTFALMASSGLVLATCREVLTFGESGSAAAVVPSEFWHAFACADSHKAVSVWLVLLLCLLSENRTVVDERAIPAVTHFHIC